MDKNYLNKSFMSMPCYSDKDIFYTHIDNLDNAETNTYTYELLHKKRKDRVCTRTPKEIIHI